MKIATYMVRQRLHGYNMSNNKTVLITAGGTGGYVFPALAVAKLLAPEYDILWVGAKGGIENKIVTENNINFAAINISGLRKNGLKRMVLMPLILLRALYQAFLIILKSRADVILGFGGYATFPVCLVGCILRIPVVIHEQNSVPGLTNKILAKIVDKVLVAFPHVLSGKRTKLVGNPVREDILEVQPPEPRYSSRHGGLNVLVIGGSLGAKIFNDELPKIFAEILDDKPNHIATITHQVGRGDIEAVKNHYVKLGFIQVHRDDTDEANPVIPVETGIHKDKDCSYLTAKINLVNFIDNMAEDYNNADLIICRSGASTVSEICAVGIAAIFIPYPHAVDNHQLYNAKPLVDIHAAEMVLQSELTSSKLADIIFSLERRDCQLMAENVRKLAIRDSTTKIKNIITTCIS
jgi:UDP-N-acetylglucosamine--N-acetylmuramyl-(pentapeptide) pyrophosphoryl-undecaprenol N-acetylglucosamine transferase